MSTTTNIKYERKLIIALHDNDLEKVKKYLPKVGTPYCIEEENMDGFTFLANIIKQKSAELVQEKNQKKNSEEKQMRRWWNTN